MKTLLQLTGILLCAATLYSATADPAAPLQTKQGEELHAAITDMPDIVDMSYADPKTWNSLPPAAQFYDHSSFSHAGLRRSRVPQLNPTMALKVLLTDLSLRTGRAPLETTTNDGFGSVADMAIGSPKVRFVP